MGRRGAAAAHNGPVRPRLRAAEALGDQVLDAEPQKLVAVIAEQPLHARIGDEDASRGVRAISIASVADSSSQRKLFVSSGSRMTVGGYGGQES